MRQPEAAMVERQWREEPLRRALSSLAAEGGYPLYVVGGAVRDVLLDREAGDWDIAGHGIIELSRRFAAEHDLRAVVLHEELPTVRIILRPGDPIGFVDLVELRAPTIEQDLALRDFTINALAWDIRGGTSIIDPIGGMADLRARSIRSVSRDRLADDPLRVLRAFRFAAQFGFNIEQRTGEWSAELAPALDGIAGERIGQEIVKLFAATHAADAVQAAENLGALDSIIPPLASLHGVEQGGFHHLDVFGHTLLALHEIERVISDPSPVFPRSAEAILLWLRAPLHRAAVRLAALFHDVGKPECMTEEEGRIRFLGHADASAYSFLDLAGKWSLPTHLRRQVVRMIRLHLRPLELASSALRAEAEGRGVEDVVTLRAVRRLMRDAEPAAIGLLLLSVADRSACRGPKSRLEQRGRLWELFDDMLTRYLDWLREMRERPRLIDGDRLMEALGVPQGPLVGELLDAIAEAYADDEIASEAEALELASRLLAEMDD